MTAFKWIMGYIRRYNVRMILGLVATTITSVLALANPYFMGLIVKNVFQENKLNMLIPFVATIIGLTILKSIIRYISLINYEIVSQNIVYNLRQDMYTRVQQESFTYFDNNKVGDIMSRMTGDLEAIRHFIAGVIYMIYENVLIFVVAIVFMFFISWELTLCMLFVTPVIGIAAYKQVKEIKPYFTDIREQFSKLNSVCQENISGNRVVKAFTREDFEIEKFTKENQAFYDKNIDSTNVWMKYIPIQEFMAGIMQVFLLLVGSILVVMGRFEVWKIVTMSGYLWALNNPLRMIGWLMNDVQRFFASLDKIFPMMRSKIRIQNPENPVFVDKVKGDVEFRNVSFKYKGSGDVLALKNISFKVKQGQTVGIVGPTGSGKTTLTNLIARFYDVREGEVLVDGIDVRNYDIHSLRKGISAAMQDVFLFSDTIEGNLAYGAPDIEMDKLIEIAKAANANDFILKTEDGYDTIVGERGVGLSGGQKQRLSLARALAVDPSILILDDTTSAVDMETEHEIQTALKEQFSGKTTFVIAHRVSSVKASDIILVLVDGEIIETGNHDELISKKGYYFELVNQQYSDLYDNGEVISNG